MQHSVGQNALLPTAVWRQWGTTNKISANCIFQLLFQHDIQHSALVLIFIINISYRLQCRAGRTTISPPNAKPINVSNGLSALHFWTLDHDLLNQEGVPISDSTVRKLQIADGVNYKFEILTKEGYRIIQSYEPETYLKAFPKMTIRKIFIDGRELFLNTWNNSRM
jgi:hypothetical protein